MTNRVKVLLICGEPPFPPNNGMRIPTWNMIKYFPQNWELSLYCATSESLKSIEQLEQVTLKFRPVCVFHGEARKMRSKNRFLDKLVKFFRFAISVKPSFSIEHPSQEISRDLGKIFTSNTFDVVILDAEFLAIYASKIPRSCYRVISPNDSITLAWENERKYKIFKNPITKLYKRENIRRAYKYEKEYYQQFNLCHFVSKVDADFVSKFIPRENIIAIPNGVNSGGSCSTVPPSKNANKAVIVGTLVGGNHRYTLRFIKDVWIRAVERNPDLELTIVSRINPMPFKKYEQKYNIRIVDYSGELGAYYQNFGMVISPVLKDCGILNKVLEGMASRRAVIGYECSFKGIPEAVPAEHMLSANTPAEMIELILSAATLKIDMDSIGFRSHKLVTEKYAWKDKVVNLTTLIEKNIKVASGNDS